MKKQAMLCEKLSERIVHCFLCAHHCRVAPSQYGICGVRQNIGGQLYTYAYGELAASHVDPVEKKPLYHFLPGSSAYSVAVSGCNFKCGFCQNWQISQSSKKEGNYPKSALINPEQIVQDALNAQCESIAYTYTEPTIFFEYAYETARLARQKGLSNIFVTNGYMTAEALQVVSPYLDACNVDLKFFNDQQYRAICGAHLQPVLDSITAMKKLGVWIEVTTLIIPGENDSDKELDGIAGFLACLSKDIPWHVSRFHPDYQFAHRPATPLETLRRAKLIGERSGLHYVYIGNVSESADTYCPRCRALLIKRSEFRIEEQSLRQGACFKCGAALAGKWK